jgi:micrococcal nuclease
MGRTSRRSRAPALLLLLLLLGGAVAWGIPEGTSPAWDRARASAGRAAETARTAAAEAADRALSPATGEAAPGAPAAGGDLRTVVRTVDGDTVVLDGNEKVRLIGINTPESVDPRRPVQPFGKEAAAFTRRLLEGRRVRVERDVEPRDRYGRSLAYLHLEDGTHVNLLLVEEGYASAYRYPPNVRYADAFRAAERRAREGRKGLWAAGGRAGALSDPGR